MDRFECGTKLQGNLCGIPAYECGYQYLVLVYSEVGGKLTTLWLQYRAGYFRISQSIRVLEGRARSSNLTPTLECLYRLAPVSRIIYTQCTYIRVARTVFNYSNVHLRTVSLRRSSKKSVNTCTRCKYPYSHKEGRQLVPGAAYSTLTSTYTNIVLHTYESRNMKIL